MALCSVLTKNVILSSKGIVLCDSLLLYKYRIVSTVHFLSHQSTSSPAIVHPDFSEARSPLGFSLHQLTCSPSSRTTRYC